MCIFNLIKRPFFLGPLDFRAMSGDLVTKESTYTILDEKNFLEFLRTSIFTKKDILVSLDLDSDTIEKKIEEKNKKKVISFLLYRMFSKPDNTQKNFSFFIFGIKLGFFSQIFKIISYLLPRKLSVVNFWKICILSEWRFSRSFKISGDFIKRGLSLNENFWTLLKEYFRLKILFFKLNSTRAKILYEIEGNIPPWWFENFSTIFTSFFTIYPFDLFLSNIIMIYAKEMWGFSNLSFYFKHLLGLVKSKFSEKSNPSRVLNALYFSLVFQKFFLNFRLKFKIDCFFKILNPKNFFFLGFKKDSSEKLLGVKFLEKLNRINRKQQHQVNFWFQNF